MRLAFRALRGVLIISSTVGMASLPARADSFTFSTVPVTGNVSGAAGTTVGWGFSITSESGSDWFVTTNLGADPFLHGTPALLFSFPTLAPGKTTTEPFNATSGSGLYEFTWNSNTPSAFVNAGNFVLSAQWWSGDPSAGGTFITDAVDASAPYSATVSSAAPVPEPASLLLFICGAVAFSLKRIANARSHGSI